MKLNIIILIISIGKLPVILMELLKKAPKRFLKNFMLCSIKQKHPHNVTESSPITVISSYQPQKTLKQEPSSSTANKN